MIQTFARVLNFRSVAANIFVLSFDAPGIAAAAKPGQFLNIKVSEFDIPLLRRPFSIFSVKGDSVEIIFNIIGIGTVLLSKKKAGEEIDIIGPLGNAYSLDEEDGTAILVGGGLGVAPLPILTSSLSKSRKKIVTYLGARSSAAIVTEGLRNVRIATDDGSSGFKGTVVELMKNEAAKEKFARARIYGCGPNPMLRALASAAKELDVPCEVSLESAMACGIGICQGCPIETIAGEKKYALVCKEGTVFDSRSVVIPG